jgi:hypothetical protein
MNTYLSRSEKELFTRLDVLLGEAGEIIKKYEKSTNTDKDFMKFMRSGYTWLNKALVLRLDMLEPDARADLKKNASHMQIILTPNDKAKKEFDRIKEMNDTLHISMDDFEDWYSGVIPFTCGKCTEKNFQECVTRKFLMKFGIFPVNTHAKGTCQYNYLDAGIDLEKIAKEISEKKKKKGEKK